MLPRASASRNINAPAAAWAGVALGVEDIAGSGMEVGAAVGPAAVVVDAGSEQARNEEPGG